MDKLDSLSLERVGFYLDNVDLCNFVEVIDISYIPSIKKCLRICDICGYVASDSAKLYKHNRNNHQRIQCTSCLPNVVHYNGFYELRQHFNWRHRVSKGHICSTCKKQYYWTSSLNRHKKYCK